MVRLGSLLDANYIVEIVDGQLSVQRPDGSAVPKKELKNHRHELLRQIASRCNLRLFTYDSYDTGRFSGGAYAGVRLTFLDLKTGEPHSVFYNARLTRDRSTRHGRKGSPLPKGQFRVDRKSKLIRLWLRLHLPLPSKLSTMHERMGKLKSIIVFASLDSNQKLDKDSIIAANICAQHIQQGSPPTANHSTIPPQMTDTFRTRVSDKHQPEDTARREAQRFSTTGKDNHVLSNQEDTNIRYLRPENKRPTDPTEQSIEEWLADYDRQKP